MAAPTNTFITNSAVGNRESLHNIISILNRDETPLDDIADLALRGEIGPTMRAVIDAL